MRQQPVKHMNAMAAAMAPVITQAAEIEAEGDTAAYVFRMLDAPEFRSAHSRLSYVATPAMQALFALRLEAAQCRTA